MPSGECGVRCTVRFVWRGVGYVYCTYISVCGSVKIDIEGKC